MCGSNILGESFSMFGSQPLWVLNDPFTEVYLRPSEKSNIYIMLHSSYEVAAKVILLLGVTTAWETLLKGHSIRKSEDHCLWATWTEDPGSGKVPRMLQGACGRYLSIDRDNYLGCPLYKMIHRKDRLCLILSIHSMDNWEIQPCGAWAYL